MKEQEEKQEEMMHKYGDCSFCGGEVKGEIVELDYRYKGDLYIFSDVPAGVCQQCGEKYLTARVAKAIEHEIRTEQEWDETRTVPLIPFSDAVPV
jgi:YgiT-type zinc finger domain-containing protein